MWLDVIYAQKYQTKIEQFYPFFVVPCVHHYEKSTSRNLRITGIIFLVAKYLFKHVNKTFGKKNMLNDALHEFRVKQKTVERASIDVFWCLFC